MERVWFSSKEESMETAYDILNIISDIEGISEQDIEYIDSVIKKMYRGVKSIEHSLLEDPEIPEKKQICFEIHISAEPSDIISDQKEFYRFLVRNIPADKWKFFVFIYM